MSVNVDVSADRVCVPKVVRSRGRRPLLPDADPFYQPPSGFGVLPKGTVLRSRKVEIALFGLVKQKFSAWQLLYRSCDLNGVPEAAVTTVLLPADARPDVDRPLLAYQCAIDAVAPQCFPSYALRLGARAFGAVPQLELMIIANALDRGWAVSIADHEGRSGYFGAAREPGYRVLDGIRAAMNFVPLGLSADTAVGVWGYSGGGMASSWVIEMAPEYAPEIDIVGAALGASVGDPGETFIRLNGTMHAGLPSLVVAGLRHIYPGLDRVLRQHTNAEGLARLDEIEKLSTAAAVLRFAGDDFDHYIDIPLADLLATPEVLEVLDDLRLGNRTPQCPVLMMQPVHDQIIAVDDVDGQAKRYRDGGAHVEYLRDQLSEHVSLMVLAAPAALEWLSDRFAGRPLARPRTKNVLSVALSVKAIRGYTRLALVAARMITGRPIKHTRRLRLRPSETQLQAQTA
ncbi:lipase [Skermania sp. ID1734]|uniref:lipase family protein n=1 Tax=Skermania sp. ID1734 TaxID=2597516 RepID=UPI0011802DAE|nr:lipase family protein [Skermania sp. ID1734]TSD99993.1 lipase [Skermania sp. ID1734]